MQLHFFFQIVSLIEKKCFKAIVINYDILNKIKF